MKAALPFGATRIVRPLAIGGAALFPASVRHASGASFPAPIGNAAL